MAIINCPNCGKEISDKATACVHCGKELKEDVQPISPQENTHVTKVDDNPPPNYMWFSVINGLIIILIGGFFSLTTWIMAPMPFISSLQVKSKWAQGNKKGAKSASYTALALNIIFIICILLLLVILNNKLKFVKM